MWHRSVAFALILFLIAVSDESQFGGLVATSTAVAAGPTNRVTQTRAELPPATAVSRAPSHVIAGQNRAASLPLPLLLVIGLAIAGFVAVFGKQARKITDSQGGRVACLLLLVGVLYFGLWPRKPMNPTRPSQSGTLPRNSSPPTAGVSSRSTAKSPPVAPPSRSARQRSTLLEPVAAVPNRGRSAIVPPVSTVPPVSAAPATSESPGSQNIVPPHLADGAPIGSASQASPSPSSVPRTFVAPDRARPLVSYDPTTGTPDDPKPGDDGRTPSHAEIDDDPLAPLLERTAAYEAGEFALVAYQAPAADGATSGSPGAPRADSTGAAGTSGDGRAPGTLGVAPPKEQPEFLRQSSVLLEPGEYQLEFGFSYTHLSSTSALGLTQNGANLVGDLVRIQRLMISTIDIRLGITPELQAAATVPFGWSSGELVFAGTDSYSNTAGIGDIGLSLTNLLQEGDVASATIMTNLSCSAPTGNSNFASSVSVPGSQLGQGFWTVSTGVTMVRVFDPLVFFGGFGYQYRFNTEVAPNVTLSPGSLVYYRAGLGYAINTRVTLNAAFNGSYIADIRLNDRRVAGSHREPMQLRLAATIARADHGNQKPRLRTVEPYLTFGLTESAPNAQTGISWSY